MALRLRALAAFAVCGLATAAVADVTDVTISGALDDPSLHLPDGRWVEGRDWGWEPDTPNALSWALETWIGMEAVDLNVNVEANADPDVTINKSLTNTTGFKWTSFLIELNPLPGFGPIVVSDSSVASSGFASHTTTNNPDGSASILYFDGSVGDGASVSFFFTFNIPGSVAFEMIQTPIPAPGALALLGVGALAAARRRR